MADPEGLRYSNTHEWIRIDDEVATLGITKHAEEELGDVALVLFPEVGRVLQAGEKFGEIESIKAVSDLFAPIAGIVTEVNSSLISGPEKVNDDPYGDGWIMKFRPISAADAGTLMDSDAYGRFLAES